MRPNPVGRPRPDVRTERAAEAPDGAPIVSRVAGWDPAAARRTGAARADRTRRRGA